MSKFIAIHLLETRRFYSKKKSLLMVLFMIFLFIFAYLGTNAYLQAMKKSGEFREMEQGMFNNMKTYDQYSYQGVRYQFIPSPAMVLFHNSGVSAEMTSRINPAFLLSLYDNLKSKAVAKSNYHGYWDFAGIFLLVISLAALFWGNETPRDKEYLKFLSTLGPGKNILCYLVISRCLLMVGTFIVTMGLLLLFLVIRGIVFSSADITGILVYMAAGVLMMILFFLAGILIGFVRSRIKAFAVILLLWVGLVFFIPGFLNLLIWEGFEIKNSEYQNELEKLNIVAAFEKIAKEENGEFNRNNLEGARKVIEKYLNKYYPRVSLLETMFKGKMAVSIRNFNTLSLFFPTTYYNLVCSEVSSCGYENFLRFYDYLIGMHREFVRFWIDRVFYHDPREMVSFIRFDENLFKGKSVVPPNFHWGLLIHCCYIAMLSWLCFFRSGRYLYHYDDRDPFKKKVPRLGVSNSKINSFYTDRTGLRDYLHNLLSGGSIKTRAEGQELEVTLDGRVLAWGEKIDGFVYVCHPQDLPGDIKALDLINLVMRCNHVSPREKNHLLETISPEVLQKTFSQLKNEDNFKIVMSMVPYIKGKVFLFFHTCKGLDIEHYFYFKTQLKRLLENGAAVINLSPETSVNEIYNKPKLDIIQLDYWDQQVESLERTN